MKLFVKKHQIFLIFLFFFALVLFQSHFLWIYFDDYGYASLSYLGNITLKNSIGYQTSLSDIVQFLIYHYQNWGGRILYFFVECVLLKFGLHPYRIIQSLIITGVFYYIYKIVTKLTNEENWKCAIFIISLYGCFEILLLRASIFWVTASVLYLFPILPLLVFVYQYMKRGNQLTKKNIIANAILLFLASWSQEQVSVLAVVFILMYTIHDWIEKKKYSISNMIMCGSALLGFALLMLSPGNQIRINHPTSAAFYNLNLFEKIAQNLPEIILNNFGINTRIFTLLFFTSICFLNIQNLKDKNGIKKINQLSLLSNSIILVFTLWKEAGYFAYFYHLKNIDALKISWILLFLIQLLLIVYNVTIYFWKRKQSIIVYLFYGAVASQIAMIVAPYFPLRSALIFEWIGLIIIGYCMIEFLKIKFIKLQTFYILFPIIAILFLNYTIITYGYIKNNSTNQENHDLLLEVSKQISNSNSITKVYLKKLPDITYSCEQPYLEGNEYSIIWIKKYYNIPQSIELIYE